MTGAGVPIDVGLPPLTTRPADGAPAASRIGVAVEVLSGCDPFTLGTLPPTWRDRVSGDLAILEALVGRLKSAVSR